MTHSDTTNKPSTIENIKEKAAHLVNKVTGKEDHHHTAGTHSTTTTGDHNPLHKTTGTHATTGDHNPLHKTTGDHNPLHNTTTTGNNSLHHTTGTTGATGTRVSAPNNPLTDGHNPRTNVHADTTSTQSLKSASIDPIHSVTGRHQNTDGLNVTDRDNRQEHRAGEAAALSSFGTAAAGGASGAGASGSAGHAGHAGQFPDQKVEHQRAGEAAALSSLGAGAASAAAHHRSDQKVGHHDNTLNNHGTALTGHPDNKLTGHNNPLTGNNHTHNTTTNPLTGNTLQSNTHSNPLTSNTHQSNTHNNPLHTGAAVGDSAVPHGASVDRAAYQDHIAANHGLQHAAPAAGALGHPAGPTGTSHIPTFTQNIPPMAAGVVPSAQAATLDSTAHNDNVLGNTHGNPGYVHGQQDPSLRHHKGEAGVVGSGIGAEASNLHHHRHDEPKKDHGLVGGQHQNQQSHLPGAHLDNTHVGSNVPSTGGVPALGQSGTTTAAGTHAPGNGGYNPNPRVEGGDNNINRQVV